MRQYRLLALDIDGTLVGSGPVVADAVVGAVAAARAGGLSVCLATGRSHAESVDVWRQIRLQPPFEPIVLVGGALVSEPDTGRTLYQRAIPFPVACEFADALGERGHVAMALVDAWRYGVDYLVTETGDQAVASRDWFSKMNVGVRRLARLADATERPEVLRVSAVVEPARARSVGEQLQGRFRGQLNVHSIVAPNYGVTIVEAHAAGADKMTALRYLAQGLGINTRQIVAVGDDINDLPMIRGAGLGVAMPHAPRSLLDAAGHVAREGLAAFIGQLAAGEFRDAP